MRNNLHEDDFLLSDNHNSGSSDEEPRCYSGRGKIKNKKLKKNKEKFHDGSGSKIFWWRVAAALVGLGLFGVLTFVGVKLVMKGKKEQQEDTDDSTRANNRVNNSSQKREDRLHRNLWDSSSGSAGS